MPRQRTTQSVNIRNRRACLGALCGIRHRAGLENSGKTRWKEGGPKTDHSTCSPSPCTVVDAPCSVNRCIFVRTEHAGGLFTTFFFLLSRDLLTVNNGVCYIVRRQGLTACLIRCLRSVLLRLRVIVPFYQPIVIVLSLSVTMRIGVKD